MAAQKHTQKNCRNILHFWMPINPKPNYSKLTTLLNPPDHVDHKIQKTGGFRELFLPENDFKNCSTVNFPKNIQILEGWKLTKDKVQIWIFFYHMPVYIWTQYKICFGQLIGTSSKCNKLWGKIKTRLINILKGMPNY